jgi:hypothetical protein
VEYPTEFRDLHDPCTGDGIREIYGIGVESATNIQGVALLESDNSTTRRMMRNVQVIVPDNGRNDVSNLRNTKGIPEKILGEGEY